MKGCVCPIPGPKTRKIMSRDHQVISPSVTRDFCMAYEKAKGCYVWDADGKKYLDFAAAIAVASVGNTNPEIVKAIKEQMEKFIHCGFSDFYAELPVSFVEELLTFMPKGFEKAFLSNSGTESVEAAYKLARWHTKKKWVIAFEGCFHGRTMGSLSMTKSKPIHRERFEPFLPVKHTPYAYCYRCAFNQKYGSCGFECLKALEKTIKSVEGDLAAIFVEPIQGEGGYVVPPKEFHKGIRELCDKYGALFCVDEVQSGCYRTGKFLAIEHYDVKPDIVSIAKGVAGGMPIGVTVARQGIMDWVPGVHANTFGGNLLSCAAAKATLNYMKKNDLGENAAKIGNLMLKELEKFKEESEVVGDVRGKGLMIGVEIVKDKKIKEFNPEKRKEVLCNALANGLLMLPCGKSTIRICPPLTLTHNEAEEGLKKFEKSFNKKII